MYRLEDQAAVARCQAEQVRLRKLGFQAHPIRFRSQGGRVALWNEIAVCPVCHGLVD
jgi:hypothetical protein